MPDCKDRLAMIRGKISLMVNKTFTTLPISV